MTRRSCRLMKRSENAPGLKRKGTKQSNGRKVQPLSKLQCEKNQLVLQGAAEPRELVDATEKDVVSREALVPRTSFPHVGCWPAEDVWAQMAGGEANHRHKSNFVQKHPRIKPRMRSILLDWLIEVSEAYVLHRQTFYLAQDYFDRFMLTQSDVDKGVLQLIGITCLFIASKMEEACPPKLSQMAHITAGTFYEQEIVQMELIILKALRWKLHPETAVSWLTLYLQLASVGSGADPLQQQFPQEDYVQMTRLLDLCLLNMNSLDFQYRVLAASVLCHFIQQETVERVSGLKEDAIQPCVSWMAPLADTLGRRGRAALRDFTGVRSEDRHNIQTHTDYLSMQDASEKKVSSTEKASAP